MKTVIWSLRAIGHLRALRAYIALDSEQNAKVAAGRILAAIARLQLFSHMGRASEDAAVRELVVPKTPYIIVYSQTREESRILAIFHAKQSWHRLV